MGGKKEKRRRATQNGRSQVIPQTSSGRLAFAGKKLCSSEEKKQTLVLGCTQMSELSSETAEKPCPGSFPLSSYLGACCNFLVSLKSFLPD